MPNALLELRTMECRGSARELGRQQGEAFRNEVQSFVRGRIRALSEYVQKRGRTGTDGFAEAGARCLEVAEHWDPEGTAEHRGIAEGANVDPAWLYAIANLSDLRDVLMFSGAPDSEGCSALLLPPERTAHDGVVAAQTWDLGPADMEFVVAIYRKPDRGPATWSVTCAGCLTLIGLNEAGLAIGTTNIKVRGTRTGVGYLSVLHRMIRETTIDRAAEVVRSAPRAAAHTYWIATADAALELECGPTQCFERTLKHTPITRTNHCLVDSLRELEGEVPTSSSKTRIVRLGELLGDRRHDVDSIRAIFSDRENGLDAISRHPEDGQPTATNACVITIPGEKRIWACRGPAERGSWIELGFA